MKNWLASLALSIFFIAPAGAHAAAASPDLSDPAAVIRAYLRALYARDFAAAYRYISLEDQRVRSLPQYLRQRSPFSGFALEIARKVAAAVEVETTVPQAASARVPLTARYRAPDPDKLAPLMRHWSGYQLNSLSAAERGQLLEAIQRKERDQSIAMISGHENLMLVREGHEWRIFLNWAQGVAIPLRALVRQDALDVEFSPDQAVIQPGEVFEVILKLRNRSQDAVVLRIAHLIQPTELADFLEIVQCGFLLPVKLLPGAEQEYSGTYLLRGSLPEGVHQLNLDYEFRPIREK